MVSAALLLASALASCGQPDRLEIESGIYGQYDTPSYEIAVARTLLAKRYRAVQMITLASFEPEEAVYIDSDTAQVVWVRARKSIWNAMFDTMKATGQPASTEGQAEEAALQQTHIELERASAPLNPKVIDELKKTWERALRNAAPKRGPNEKGEVVVCTDGTSYQFADWERGAGYRTGSAWSPEKGSPVADPVALGDELAAYARAPAEERATRADKLALHALVTAKRFKARAQ